jgi:hypothetical protein
MDYLWFHRWFLQNLWYGKKRWFKNCFNQWWIVIWSAILLLISHQILFKLSNVCHHSNFIFFINWIWIIPYPLNCLLIQFIAIWIGSKFSLWLFNKLDIFIIISVVWNRTLIVLKCNSLFLFEFEMEIIFFSTTYPKEIMDKNTKKLEYNNYSIFFQ